MKCSGSGCKAKATVCGGISDAQHPWCLKAKLWTTTSSKKNWYCPDCSQQWPDYQTLANGDHPEWQHVDDKCKELVGGTMWRHKAETSEPHQLEPVTRHASSSSGASSTTDNVPVTLDIVVEKMDQVIAKLALISEFLQPVRQLQASE